MSNTERAEYVLYEWADSLGGLESIDREYGGAMDGAAQALADENLLAPELPEPKEIEDGVFRWNGTHAVLRHNVIKGADVEWKAPGGVTAYPDEVLIDVDIDHMFISPAEARALGLALLAAADKAEKGAGE